MYTQDYLTVLLLDLEKKMKCILFWPFGALPRGPPNGAHIYMYHLNNFESLTPKDDPYQVKLKSDHDF